MSTFGDALAACEEIYRQVVLEETWGHLAPKKNKTYKGRVVYATGCYDNGDLNPTPLSCNLKGLDSSPWFYSAIHEWLQDLPEEYRKEGCVYEWRGTFRNYEFNGKVTLILDGNTVNFIN
jgi:hypothetical protein